MGGTDIAGSSACNTLPPPVSYTTVVPLHGSLTTMLGSGWFPYTAGGTGHAFLEHDPIIGIDMEEQGLVELGYDTYKERGGSSKCTFNGMLPV